MKNEISIMNSNEITLINHNDLPRIYKKIKFYDVLAPFPESEKTVLNIINERMNKPNVK